MDFSRPTFNYRIYREFQTLESTAYRDIIRFYEEHEPGIKELDADKYFELLVAYIGALFETGAYSRYLALVDVVIEYTIDRSIVTYKGVDIFQNLLFRKAAALYNLLEYDRADYILREILRMNPSDEDSAKVLKKCLRRKRPLFLHRARAAAISAFLLSALVISVEVLMIRPFYAEHATMFEEIRMALFLLGCAILISSDLIHRWRIEREVKGFVAGVKTRT